jgi:hypothetical protein
LNAKKAVLLKDLDAIGDISETMANYSKSLAGDTVAPRQAERFFESLLTRTREISSTRADLEEEILQLSRQIDVLSSTETKKKGKTNGEVTVVIMAKNATDVELRLTYRMSSPMLVELLPPTVLLLLASCQIRDMVCGVRATRHFGSWRSRLVGIPALSCPHHTEHRGRLDKRRAHIEHRRHGPIKPDDSHSQSYEDSTPTIFFSLQCRASADTIPCSATATPISYYSDGEGSAVATHCYRWSCCCG